MSKFDEFINAVLSGTEDLAKDTLRDLVKDSLDDAKDFLDTTKDDLALWTEQLAKGELSKDEFEFLVLGKKDLAQLLALKRAGLTEAKIESFQNAVINLVISSAFKVFL
jgi:hypothetical protein